MANEVYSIGIDIGKLKEALKVSEKIKDNTSATKKGGMMGDLDKSNKKLKEQNKQLGITASKLNLIRLTASKLKFGALALGGLAVGGAISSLMSAKGSIATDLRARNVGLNFGESQALGYAGKMTGLGEDTLLSSIEGLTTSLRDFSKSGNFASLGLNAEALKNKNPTQALFDVLDAMKKSNLPEYLKKNIIDEIGIPFDQFRFVLKEGTGEIKKYFDEGLGLYGKDGAGLKAGERAMMRFMAVIKDISQMVAIKLIPAFTRALKVLTPLIRKSADLFAQIIDNVFTTKNLNMLDNFIKQIIKYTSSVVDWLKNFIQDFVKGLTKVWDFLKPSITSLGKELLAFWEEIKPDLMKFGKWLQTQFLPVFFQLMSSMITFLGNIVRNIRVLWNTIRPVMRPLGQAIKMLFGVLSKAFDTLSKFKVESVLDPLSKVGDMGANFGNKIQEFFTSFTNAGMGVWKKIVQSAGDLWTGIKQAFLVMITGLIDAINGILSNSFISKMTGGALIRTGWGYDSEGNFGKRTYTGKGAKDYKYTQINDGVIHKNGQVIKTAPDDYIFAMKQPQKLATAGAGNYNININATVRNDSDVQKIKNELHKLITSLNAKR